MSQTLTIASNSTTVRVGLSATAELPPGIGGDVHDFRVFPREGDVRFSWSQDGDEHVMSLKSEDVLWCHTDNRTTGDDYSVYGACTMTLPE